MTDSDFDFCTFSCNLVYQPISLASELEPLTVRVAQEMGGRPNSSRKSIIFRCWHLTLRFILDSWEQAWNFSEMVKQLLKTQTRCWVSITTLIVEFPYFSPIWWATHTQTQDIKDKKLISQMNYEMNFRGFLFRYLVLGYIILKAHR